MSEAYARFSQYEYRANSNLVLTVENRQRITEPTGEPESLSGRIKTTEFGDRARPDKVPAELRSRIEKIRKRKRGEKEPTSKKTKHGKPEDVLSVADIYEGYRPKTKETQAAYEELLTNVQQVMGDQPADVLRDAANEVLAVLKDESVQGNEKKKRAEDVLSVMSQDRFTKLVEIGKRINDFSEEGDVAGRDELDEKHGVSVVFDESESDEDDFEDVLRDEESDEDEGEEAHMVDTLEARDVELSDEESEATDQLDLDVKKIDAFWLQRELGKFFKDAHSSQQMAEEVMEILEDKQADQRHTENRLVQLLDYEKFDLIKLLLRNRWKVVYCVRLARAQDDAERELVEEEMKSSRALRAILDALHKKSSTAEKTKDLERSIRKEARNLGGIRKRTKADDVYEGEGKAPKQTLDLESLAFAQGGKTW